MEEKLDGLAVPKAPKRVRGKSGEAQKAIGNELAALAYVAMENGDYVYPPGVQKPAKSDPDQINRGELMRLAGYQIKDGPGSKFNDSLGSKREFWQLVELYRLRRTDPMFRKDFKNHLIGAIAEKLSDEIAETIFYYPHTITFRDKIMALKTIVDLGYRVTPEGSKQDNRASRLLDSMPVDQRQQAIAGLKAKAEADIVALESLELAHEAADDGH
jgi:hypothetical protein